MTSLESFISKAEKYEQLSGSEKTLVKQLSIFHQHTALVAYTLDDIHNVYMFLASLQYDSAWYAPLYKEISNVLIFLYAFLESKNYNGSPSEA